MFLMFHIYTLRVILMKVIKRGMKIIPKIDIKKSLIILMVSFVLCFVFFVISCAPKTPELTFGDLVICEDLKQDTHEPVGPKNEFDARVNKICASIKFSGVKGEDNYRFNWINLDTGETALDETLKYSEEEKGYLEGYAASYIYATEEIKIIPPGNYRVEFYHNGELRKTASFKVNKPEVRILEVALANQVDENYKPVNITQKFNPGETVYACVKVDYLIIGNTLKAKWYTSRRDLILEAKFDMDRDWYEPSYVTFDFKAESGILSPDTYSVEIYLNDNLYGTFDFEVVSEDIFSKGNTYSSSKYGFSFAIPDDWEYTEKEDSKSLQVDLTPTSTDLQLGFSFIISSTGDYPPEEQFSALADEMAESVTGDYDWSQIDKQENDEVLKNGIDYKEFVYKFNDNDNNEWTLPICFIEHNNRLYIFFGIVMADYYGIAQPIYNGILDSVNFG